MVRKPAISNIGRPQGFIDDAAKAALKAVKGAASRYQVMRGPLNRNVKDSIKGAAKKDNVVLNMYANQSKKPRNFKGSIMPKKGGIPRKKFEKIYGPVEPNPRFASPKVQQQIARSKTKRRSMTQTTRMADKYYGK